MPQACSHSTKSFTTLTSSISRPVFQLLSVSVLSAKLSNTALNLRIPQCQLLILPLGSKSSCKATCAALTLVA
ncbi:hypothetical protein CKAH01_01259 [Colletotrichum kahawae]|uniref:Uncharacterized protein n=1 Tax=Colletotrichum kahawae TaxID=34407 RepID=A0AAE0D407_COLKA|nr:hypothetical protein CKAH01_01259 [Colletotrichum kahawae]